MSKVQHVQEIDHALDQIAQTFSALDIESWLGFYRFPSTLVFRSQLVPISSLEDLRALAVALMGALRERDFDRSEIAERNIQILGDGAAIASVVWARYKRDNSVLERFSATYTLLRDDEGWRIVSLITHSPETVLRFH